MKKPSLILILLIAVGVIGFVLGHLNLSHLISNNSKQTLSTYPVPNDELSINCVGNLWSIRELAETLKVRYTTLLTMGVSNEKTDSFYVETSAEDLPNLQKLSQQLKCPDSYALPVNLQNQIVITYGKIDRAYFYYRKDVKTFTAILQTGESSEVSERISLEKDTMNDLLDEVNKLGQQYLNELDKIRHN